MDSVIAFAAQYLLFIMVAGFAVFWLFGTDRAGKLRLGGAAVIGLILAVVFLLAAGKLHADPRPFVQNPRLHPLFPHARDNGFPSDHSIAAGLIAGLVLFWSRLWGAVFALVACCVAAARVAAHVHHVQDVVAGLMLGGIAAVLGYYTAGAVLAIVPSRMTLPLAGPGRAPRTPTTSEHRSWLARQEAAAGLLHLAHADQGLKPRTAPTSICCAAMGMAAVARQSVICPESTVDLAAVDPFGPPG